MAIIFYDTETTGLPDWHAPSDSPQQPHLVQIAAILTTDDCETVIADMNVLVRPEGWEIEEEAEALHGISHEHATKYGVPEETAVRMFFDLWGFRKRIAHNERFDMRIMRIAAKRYIAAAKHYLADESFPDAWKEAEAECTGLLTKPIMKMEPKNRYGYKMPKLSEAYEHFVGKPLQDAHSAMADAIACMEIYKRLPRDGD